MASHTHSTRQSATLFRFDLHFSTLNRSQFFQQTMILFNWWNILHFSHSNVSQTIESIWWGKFFLFCLCTTSDSCQFAYVSDIRWKTRSLTYCMYLLTELAIKAECKMKTMTSMHALRCMCVCVCVWACMRVQGRARKTFVYRRTRQFAYIHKLWHCLIVLLVRIRTYMRTTNTLNFVGMRVCLFNSMWMYARTLTLGMHTTWQCSGAFGACI